MPATIVDRLEVIEIDQDDLPLAQLVLMAFQCRAMLFERETIVKPGQLVISRQSVGPVERFADLLI